MVKTESYFCGTTIVGLACCILAMTNWGWFFWIPGGIALAIGLIALSFGPKIAQANANVPIILYGPMLWADTMKPEPTLLLPAASYKDITPERIQSESMWFDFIEEARNKIREKMTSVTDDQLAGFDLKLFMETVNALVDAGNIHYRKLYLKETKYRRDKEELDPKGKEYPYKECWILTTGEWNEVFSRPPLTIEIPYPDKDGFDVKINAHPCMMIGIGLVQVTVPVIFIANSYDQSEKLAKQIIEKNKDEVSPITPLSANEMTIKTQNAAIQQFRLDVKDQEKTEAELISERDAEIGKNEILKEKVKKLSFNSLNKDIAEMEEIEASQGKTDKLPRWVWALVTFVGICACLFGYALGVLKIFGG